MEDANNGPYALSRYRDRRVHTVHSDLRVCELICTIFRIEGFEVAFSTDATAFREGIDRRPPDAVVIGDSVGEIDGIDLLSSIKSRRRGIPVLLVLDTVDLERAVLAMRHGAIDVLAKPIDGERLIRSLKRAIDASSAGGRPRPAGYSRLTRREQQVLDYVLDGATNKEAARELNISPRTVEVHRHRVMEKMGARNTAELVRIALG